jgi:3-mercaptopyruvate sulfurtransferase SseA
MMAGGFVLILAVILWQVISANQSPSAPAPTANPAQADIPFPEVTRISLTDAKAAYDAGAAIFLDVRDTDSYAAKHIPGALHIELAALPSRLSELDPSRPIITYCT